LNYRAAQLFKYSTKFSLLERFNRIQIQNISISVSSFFLRYAEYFQLFCFTTSYPDTFGHDYEVTVRQEEQKKVLAHIELTLSYLQYFPILLRNE